MPIDDRDLTTIMVTLGDIRQEVRAIRKFLLEEDDGEEEAPGENT